MLQQYAENTNRTIAELVRKLAFNQKVTIKYELVADIKKVRQLQIKLGGIGGNLKQITRHFSTGGIHSQEMRKQIKIALSEILKMKREVIKMAENFQQVREQHHKCKL